MKKTLSAKGLVLLWLALLSVMLPAQNATPKTLSSLAPADSMIMVEWSDLARSCQRFQELSISQVAKEPEWKEFTKNVVGLADDFMESQGGLGALKALRETKPKAGFIAITGDLVNSRAVTVGFSYDGKPEAVDAAYRELLGLMGGTDAAKSPGPEKIPYEGLEIQAVAGPGFKLYTVHRNQWFFLSNQLEAVKAVLLRQSAGANAKESLAEDALYLAAQKQALPDGEGFVFLRSGALMKTLLGGAVELSPMFKYQADTVSYSLKFDGRLMRDRLYIHGKDFPKVKPLVNRPLAFTSPDTYLYGVSNIAGWEGAYREMLEEMEKQPGIQATNKDLEKYGVKVSDLPAAFGVEWSIQSDWEAGGLSLPTLFISAEVRDPVKMKGFVDYLVTEIKKHNTVLEKEEGGTRYWTMKLDLPVIQPTLGLNDGHVVFGLNYPTANGGIKQLTAPGPKLGESPAYVESLKTVISPSVGLFYVDVKTLFERLYEKFKPILAFQITGSPELAKYLDAGKMPRAEVISKHLLPLVISYGDAPEGFMLESSGSFCLYPMILPTAGALFGMRAAPARIEIEPKPEGAPR